MPQDPRDKTINMYTYTYTYTHLQYNNNEQNISSATTYRSIRCTRTCHFSGMLLGNPHYSIASLNLLGHKWFGRSQEHYLAVRVPPIEVVHDDGSDECLSQSSRETHQRVSEESFLDNVVLVISNGVVSGVDPKFSSVGIKSGNIFFNDG